MGHARALGVDACSTPTFLVSDIHAGAFDGENDRRLRGRMSLLLEHVRASDGRLVVLGDMFDYWQHRGSRYPMEFRPWLRLFERHHQSAPGSMLLTGNHDHWAGGPVEDAGFSIVSDHIAASAGDGVYLLLHGDGLPGPDLSLRRTGLNAQFRKPVYNRLFATLPLTVRVQWMRAFSAHRRQRHHEPAEASRTEAVLADWLGRSDYAGLVFGHTHAPSQRNIGRQIVVNLGTFFRDECVGILTDGGFRLTHLHQIEASSPQEPPPRTPDGPR